MNTTSRAVCLNRISMYKMKKPSDPRATINLAESRLLAARNGRVDVSDRLLADLIALSRAWVFTRARTEATAPLTEIKCDTSEENGRSQ